MCLAFFFNFKSLPIEILEFRKGGNINESKVLSRRPQSRHFHIPRNVISLPLFTRNDCTLWVRFVIGWFIYVNQFLTLGRQINFNMIKLRSLSLSPIPRLGSLSFFSFFLGFISASDMQKSQITDLCGLWAIWICMIKSGCINVDQSVWDWEWRKRNGNWVGRCMMIHVCGASFRESICIFFSGTINDCMFGPGSFKKKFWIL